VLLAVALGGALGTWVRYEMTLALPATPGSFPWAIFAVNTAGAFILGAAMTLLLERFSPRQYVRPFVGIGFCGGLTTFSTWMVDATVLADGGHLAVAVLDVVATVLVGIGSLVLGVWAARTLIRERSGL
jgi:CrcB protein